MAVNMTTPNQPRAFLDSAVGDLVVRPLQAQSVALQAATMVRINEAANAFRVPAVTEDPSVAWVAEGEEIPASGARLAEDADFFHKLAGLTNVSSEFLNDSSPAVAEVVTKGLARSLALKLDAAFFGKRGATDTKAPRGLGDITGINTIAAGAKISNLDPFVEAVYAASKAGGSVLNSFVSHPDDALSLAKIKERSDSQRALLQSDPTKGGPTGEDGTILPAATIAGVPLFTTPACPKGTIWGIPKDSVVVAVRKDFELTKNDSVYFTSDVTAVRALARVTTVFGHPAAIQKITIG
jgi:phage capsid family